MQLCLDYTLILNLSTTSGLLVLFHQRGVDEVVYGRNMGFGAGDYNVRIGTAAKSRFGVAIDFYQSSADRFNSAGVLSDIKVG